ncbi:MAG: copper resistance protein CopC [Anaerolineae bacterium]|nr:copper resistance protein CopC [Anaerolineae bacterium]
MRKFALLVMLPALLVGPGRAHAHASLDHASPAVGSTVPVSPNQVSLTFTQSIERKFNRMEVRNAGGTRVDNGNVSVSGNTMRVGVKGLEPGRYTVRWRVLSVDTHTTEGSFNFQVGR